MFDIISLYAGRDRYDWATTSDREREQIYCYPCGLLQQVARSSSPSWQDSSWSSSVSLWAVLQVGSQNVHMTWARLTYHYLQIWLLWGHHLRPRKGVCEQGEGGAAAVDRDWTPCHISLSPTEQWTHGKIQPDSPDCPHKLRWWMIHKMTGMNTCLQCCSHIELHSRRQPRCHPLRWCSAGKCKCL